MRSRMDALMAKITYLLGKYEHKAWMGWAAWYAASERWNGIPGTQESWRANFHDEQLFVFLGTMEECMVGLGPLPL